MYDEWLNSQGGLQAWTSPAEGQSELQVVQPTLYQRSASISMGCLYWITSVHLRQGVGGNLNPPGLITNAAVSEASIRHLVNFAVSNFLNTGRMRVQNTQARFD